MDIPDDLQSCSEVPLPTCWMAGKPCGPCLVSYCFQMHIFSDWNIFCFLARWTWEMGCVNLKRSLNYPNSGLPQAEVVLFSWGCLETFSGASRCIEGNVAVGSMVLWWRTLVVFYWLRGKTHASFSWRFFLLESLSPSWRIFHFM